MFSRIHGMCSLLIISENTFHTNHAGFSCFALQEVTLENQTITDKQHQTFVFQGSHHNKCVFLSWASKSSPHFLLLAKSGFGFDTPSLSLTAVKVKGTNRESKTHKAMTHFRILWVLIKCQEMAGDKWVLGYMEISNTMGDNSSFIINFLLHKTVMNFSTAGKECSPENSWE